MTKEEKVFETMVHQQWSCCSVVVMSLGWFGLRLSKFGSLSRMK
jgi:hypothetical protein